MSSINLIEINNQAALMKGLSKIDKNEDLSVSPDETSKKEVKALDKDGNGTAEIWEFMTAVNEQRKAEIFKATDIQSAKKAYEYLKDPTIEKLANKYGRTLIFKILQSGIKAKFTKADIIDLLKEVAQTVKGYTLAPAYGSLPEVISALQKAHIDKNEIIVFLKEVAKASKLGTYSAYEQIPEMIEAGVDLKEMIDFFKAVRMGENFRTVGMHMIYVQSAGLNKKETMDFIKFAAPIAREHPGKVYKPFIAMIKAGFNKEVKDPQDYISFKKGLLFMLPYGKGDMKTYIETLGLLKINPIVCQDKDSFAAELALKINQALPTETDEKKLNELASRIAVAINTIHNNDIEIISDKNHPEHDLIRKTICKNLSIPSMYYILSSGGADLFTSTFLEIYDNLVQQKDFLEKIEENDPSGKHMTGFILTLASFNHFTKIFTIKPEYFFAKIKDHLLSDRQNILRNGSLLVKTIEEIMTNAEFGEHKAKTENMLLELFKGFSENNHVEGKGVLGYIIKVCRDKFSAENTKEARSICKNLPEILEPKIPKEWLADKTITAKLYMYHRGGFKYIQKMYCGGYYNNGKFVKVKKYEGKHKGFKINLKGSDSKTVVLTKRLNGKSLKVIITMDNSDVEESLKDPAIDIIAHRGHSFQLNDTFKYHYEARDMKKLLYLGSCGSFRAIPALMKNFFGNYFIADENTGRAVDNNKTLYYMMEAIAKGYKDWDEVGKYVDKRIGLKKRGLVFPNDKSLLIFDFVERLSALD